MVAGLRMCFAGLVLVGSNACTPDSPVNMPPPAAAATATLPMPPATASARVYAALQKNEVPLQVLNHEALGPMFRNFVLYTNQDERIDMRFRPRPENDYSDRVIPMTVSHLPPVTVGPALRAYVGLPVAERKHDLLMSVGREYWDTPDYRRDGQALPYACNFILHFGSDGASGTVLEVIGIDSRIQDGKEWRIAAAQDGLGLPLPRHLPRVRDAAPAPHDNRVVLDQLVKLLR